MANPKAVYENLLALAKAGRGDGTIYASGSTAVPNAGNKTFDLSPITFISDLTEVDGVLKGYELVFLASGNTYLITDYVEATDLATVKDTPIATDAGAYEVRKTLWTPDFASASPLRLAADGRKHTSWIQDTVSTDADILAYLPNLIDDGDFEAGSLGAYWGAAGDGDSSQSEIATSEQFGDYLAQLSLGTTGTTSAIHQAGKEKLYAGRTYGIIFEARRLTGAVADAFDVTLRYASGSPETYIPVTFTLIDTVNDSLGDLGQGTDNQWLPQIETAAAWQEAAFQVPEDIEAGDWNLWLNNTDSVNRRNVRLDGVYIWEIKQPGAFMISGHNFAGGFPAGSHCTAYRLNPHRSGTGVDDRQQLHDLDNPPVGSEIIYERFTPTTSIFPVFRFFFGLVTGITFQASELWIGEEWSWSRPPNRILTGMEDEVESIQTYSRAHVGVGELLAEFRAYQDEVTLVEPAEALIWRDFRKKNGHGAPFWLIIPADAALGQAEEIIFMRCPQAPRIDPDLPGFYRVGFTFEEAF